MRIKLGFDIELNVSSPGALVFMLAVHPSRQRDLVTPENIVVTPPIPMTEYRDCFGNECARLAVPSGITTVRLQNDVVIRDSGRHDFQPDDARAVPLAALPPETLQFLLPSRYCDFDSALMQFAWDRFGVLDAGAAQVRAICDFVHQHIRFNYQKANSRRTALGGFNERVGVCRDYAHLAVSLCRALNLPARYVTGYLGDIGVPAAPEPMDFSAWFEVYLEGGWYTYDARHNAARIGRIPIAKGRDAVDVPIAMTFGPSQLKRFNVVTELAPTVVEDEASADWVRAHARARGEIARIATAAA